MSDDAFTTLLSALARAESTGTTDEDAARIAQARAFSSDLIDLIIAKYGSMTANDVLKTLALTIGCCIKNNAEDSFSAALIAAEMAQVMFASATSLTTSRS